MIAAHPSRRLVLGGAVGAAAFVARPNSGVAGSGAGSNAWPDPQFCIQDASPVVPAMNDVLTGPIPPAPVDGYTTGAREVTARRRDRRPRGRGSGPLLQRRRSCAEKHCGAGEPEPAGSIFVLGEFTHCESDSALPDGAFSTPRAQFVRFLASVSPWVGKTVTIPASGGFLLDLRQQSDGAINEGVSMLHGLVEGQSRSIGGLLVFASSAGAPALDNPILHREITGPDGDPAYYAFASGVFNVTDGEPRMWVHGRPGLEWKHVSFDLHGATLFAGP
jgi:hypothetical protein